jgi:hypothetical protein
MTDKPLSHDRRALLSRGGKTALLLTLPAALSACLQVEDNATRRSNGVTQIQIQTGLNCWKGQCFRYNGYNHLVSAPGREWTSIPDDIEITDGFVTEDEFERIRSAARLAPRKQRDSGNGGSNNSSNGGSNGIGGVTGGTA